MTTDLLTPFSNGLADLVAGAAPSVVQVRGRRRPASGVVYARDVIVTTMRALGSEDDLQVRRDDGTVFDAALAGWDPTTSLAVIRATGLDGAPLQPAESAPRVGQLAMAIARSWSNAVTASAGLVSVIGGPLPTGRRRAIDQVLRTSAPMHDGFAGGAFVDPAGCLLGITTSTRIRGLGVVIPAAIAWRTVATVLEHGTPRRGYLGLAGQPVDLPATQRGDDGRGKALVVVGVTDGSPASAAGVQIGDLVMAVDGQAIESPEDLLDLLMDVRAGREMVAEIRRGASAVRLTITVGERPEG